MIFVPYGVQISEIMYHPYHPASGSENPRQEWIELYNGGPGPVDLGGWSLADGVDYVFPDVVLEAGGYLVVAADVNVFAAKYPDVMNVVGGWTGWLSNTGETLALADDNGAVVDAVSYADEGDWSVRELGPLDRSQRGWQWSDSHDGGGKSRELINSVEFGAQVPDLSIGLIGDTGLWHLTVPTLGQANISHPLGDPRAVRINEWLATEEVLFTSDFIELYNPDPLPVDLGGFYLTDTPETEPDRHRLSPLNFVPGGGYAVFTADNHVKPGHLGFKLSPGGDMLALFDAAFHRIDEVIFGPQTRDVSQGRSPDGDNEFAYFPAPTPGAPNPGEKKTTTTVVIALVEEKADKKVLVPAGPVSDDWQGGKPFDDSTWMLCTGVPGGVGFERGQGYDSLITLDTEGQMYGTGKNNSCYVRVSFTVDAAALAGINGLTLKARCDDGFVVYLNGKEVARFNFAGTPAWNSHADSAVEANGQDFDEAIDISANLGELKAGANLLAIHAMNSGSTSSDFLISVALDAVVVNEKE